jgi:hypothetical protein
MEYLDTWHGIVTNQICRYEFSQQAPILLIVDKWDMIEWDISFAIGFVATWLGLHWNDVLQDNYPQMAELTQTLQTFACGAWEGWKMGGR